jgi:hypothetical protein
MFRKSNHCGRVKDFGRYKERIKSNRENLLPFVGSASELSACGVSYKTSHLNFLKCCAIDRAGERRYPLRQR